MPKVSQFALMYVIATSMPSFITEDKFPVTFFSPFPSITTASIGSTRPPREVTP